VRSARSISGRASLRDRAAGRLEFQASTILLPSDASDSTAGTNNTGRPVKIEAASRHSG
jgi:hypothetical protein